MTPQNDQEKHLRQALSDLVFGIALFVIFILLGVFSASQASPAAFSYGQQFTAPGGIVSGQSLRFHDEAIGATTKRFVGASSAARTRGSANAPMPGTRPLADVGPGACPAGSEALANRTPGDWCSVRQVVLLSREQDWASHEQGLVNRKPELGAFDRRKYAEAVTSGFRLNDAGLGRAPSAHPGTHGSRKHVFLAMTLIFVLAGGLSLLFWTHLGRAYRAQI